MQYLLLTYKQTNLKTSILGCTARPPKVDRLKGKWHIKVSLLNDQLQKSNLCRTIVTAKRGGFWLKCVDNINSLSLQKD